MKLTMFRSAGSTEPGGTRASRAPMRRPPWRALLALGRALALPAALGVISGIAQAADIGVSVHVSQPGVYGRVDIGRFPQPQVIVTQPVVVQPLPRPPRPRPGYVVAQPEPVYMWVPPGHRKNWRRHCARYGACGVPVYFVRDDWYQRELHRHDARGGEVRRRPPRDRQPGDDRGLDRGLERGHDRGHEPGQGRGHDKGRGRGHGRD